MIELLKAWDLNGVSHSPGKVNLPALESELRRHFPNGEGYMGTIWREVLDVAATPDASLVNGLKHDQGKPPLDLIDAHFIEDVALVLAFGARKYTVDNWKKGMAVGKALGGVLRHTYAVLRGELKDPETGLSHLAHAACGLMFAHNFLRTGNIKADDRWLK